MADYYPVSTIAGRRVLNPIFQLEDRTVPRLVAACPKCSSTDTAPLSYIANTRPSSVYECRACAHVWRVLQADTAAGAIRLRPDQLHHIKADAPRRRKTDAR
jgi:hypothetical protein